MVIPYFRSFLVYSFNFLYSHSSIMLDSFALLSCSKKCQRNNGQPYLICVSKNEMHVNSYSLLIQFNLKTKKITKKKDSKFKIITLLFH